MLNYELIKNEINNFSLSQDINREDFEDLFAEHLRRMGHFCITEKHILNEKTYYGFEQNIFENSEVAEAKPKGEIEWDLIDQAKHLFKTKFLEIFGEESHSRKLKPIIQFSLDSFENYLIYESLYPNSELNPWTPLKVIILEKELLLYVTALKKFAQEIYGNNPNFNPENLLYLIIVINLHKKL